MRGGTMEITDVRVKKLNSDNRLKAIAAITIDECFVVHELRIIDGKDGLFVAMPSRKMPNGEFKDVAHPINQETRNKIESVVIEAFNNLEEEPADEPADEPSDASEDDADED